MDEQQRKWFCRISKTNNTQQGLYEYNFDDVFNKLSSKYDNILMAIHDKEETNIHAHIVIQNASAIRFSTIKKLLPYGDIEKQRGTNLQCYQYCLHIDEKSKETEKQEYDESCIKTNIDDIEVWKKLSSGGGSRSDLIKLTEMVKNGASDLDIMNEYPSQFMVFCNSINKVRQTYLREINAKQFRHLEVVYIYGSTGVGKTRFVMEKHGYDKVFRVTDYGTGAFDGYNGQDIILFDEFRSSITITQMLTLLDGYPVELPCRFANKSALYTKVYIVSNIPLSQQYPNVQKEEPKTYDAFLRRINVVYNFDKSKNTPITHDARLIPLDIDIGDIF